MKKYSIFTKILAGTLSLVMASVLAVSCASTPETSSEPKATLEELPYRMAWAIHGTDINGDPSTIIIQGTIHAGDDRLYPLDTEVVTMFQNADRIAAEISSKEWKKMTGKIQSLMRQGLQEAAGRNVLDYLTEEELEVIYSIMDPDSARAFGMFMPWVMKQTLSSFVIAETGLDAEYALDSNLLAYAEVLNKNVIGLDTLQTQLDVISFGDYDIQIAMLKDALNSLHSYMFEEETENSMNEVTTLYNMYNCYLNNDREGLLEILNAESEEESENMDFYEEYSKMLMNDRNEKWADMFDQWLSEGGTTFVYAGSAHFLGDSSVFSYMEQMGTLE